MILALILPPIMRFALSRWGYNRVHSWLQHNISLPAAPLSLLEIPEIINLAKVMNISANRSPIHTNCLQRSLTLWSLLRRKGIESELRIGVDKQSGALKAHAWLEKDGVVLNDTKASVQGFTPFDQAIEPAMFDTL